MTDRLNKLWLKGQAEEDIYIAKHERELKSKKLREKRKDVDAKTHNHDKQ